MKTRTAVLIATLLLMQVEGTAQPGSKNVSKAGTVAAPFLEIPVGAASIGMGTATVSHVNDPAALYWNPAGSAVSDMNQVTASHMAWIADTRFDFVGVTLPLSDLGRSLGFVLLWRPSPLVVTAHEVCRLEPVMCGLSQAIRTARVPLASSD